MRVLLIDDHPLMLDALSTVVSLLEGIECVERAATLAQAIARISADPPYALHIVDMALPDANGTQGVEQLRLLRPDVPVAVFTGNDDPTMVSKAVDAGARGYILKNTPADTLQSALRSILGGGYYFPQDAVDRLMATAGTPRVVHAPDGADAGDAATYLGRAGLTRHEINVLRLVCGGMTNKQIGSNLYMAEGTVKTHLASIYSKLGVHSRVQTLIRVRAMLGAARCDRFAVMRDTR